MRTGHVPTERIEPVLSLAISQRWPSGGGLEVLAEKAGCDVSTIEDILETTNPGVSFDLADRLLCAVGAQGTWWGELSDVYYAVEFRETCAAPGCNKQFPEYHRGGRPKRTCSPRCRARLEAMKLGRVKYAPGARVMGRCNRGHRLTPDNVKISKGTGFRRCRKCARAADRERARLRREALRAA